MTENTPRGGGGRITHDRDSYCFLRYSRLRGCGGRCRCENEKKTQGQMFRLPVRLFRQRLPQRYEGQTGLIPIGDRAGGRF